MCDTCDGASDSEDSCCFYCKHNSCKKCSEKMNVWKEENYDLCRFLNLPYNLQICSRCLFSMMPREGIEDFEEVTNTSVNLPVLHLPEEECQGNGIYRGEFQCKECREKFCRKCIVRDEKGSAENCCLNCAQ